jgi:hypothetical protein
MEPLGVRGVGHDVVLMDVVQQEGEAAVPARVSRIPVMFVLKDVEGAHFVIDIVFNNHDVSVWFEETICF